MAEGDTFLGFLKDAVNSVPVLGAYSNAAWGQGNYDPNPPATPAPDLFSADASASQRIGSLVNAVPLLHVAGTAIMATADNAKIGDFAPLKFLIEAPNRAFDSLATGGAALGDDNEETSWADGWAQGWNSWGTDNHLSGGQILASSINNGFSDTGISPFTQQGVKDTIALSRTTWYGDLAGASSDVAAAFIVPMPTKLATVGREASTIKTGAQADAVAEAFNAGQRAAPGSAFFKPSSPAVHATLLEQVTEKLYARSGSLTDTVNMLGPMLGEQSARNAHVLAEMFNDARVAHDPVTAKHIISNLMLTVQGSDAARAELMAVAPLTAAKLANATTAPAILGDVVKAQDQLVAQWTATPGKVDVNSVMSGIYNTPRKQAEIKALEDRIAKSKIEAGWTADLKQRMVSLKPPKVREKVDGQWVDTFDTARLKEARAKADSQYKDLQAKLDEAKANLTGTQRWADGANKATVTKGAMKDAGAAADSAAGRDAVAAFGPTGAAQDFNQSLGASKQIVDDLSAQVAQAKADRELLASTPLGRGRSEKVDALNAQKRVLERELKADTAKLGEIAPALNATHNWLASIDSLGRDNVVTQLNLKPSKLSRLKTAFRDEIGETYLYSAGDLNSKVAFHVMPKSWVANVGTRYGRSAINVIDRYVGAQELGMYLKKSKVYDGPEIKALTEDFHRLQPAQVQGWIDGVHKDMLTRLVADVRPELSAADVQKAVGDIATGMGQHREYLQQALKDANTEGRTWARVHEFPDEFASDAVPYVNTAYLGPHLAETAAFADPFKLREALRTMGKNGNLVARVRADAAKTLDMTVTGWKIASILRPGIAVRNMLDSNVRAYAIMGAVPTLMQTSKGVAHLFQNSGLRVGDWVSARNADLPASLKIGLQDPQGVARHMLNETTVKLGDKQQKIGLYDVTEKGDVSAVSLAGMRTAFNKGISPTQGLLSTGTRSGFTNVSESRVMYKADSIEWPVAYQQHAQVLLSSPTARELIKQATIDSLEAGISRQRLTDELFANPAIRGEYAKLREYHEMAPEQFIDQVLRETEIMFPDPGMAQDLLAGKFHGRAGKKWIEDNFPKEQRFDVPGEQSIYNTKGIEALRVGINKAMSVLQDAPDFWLARHPVAKHAFDKQAKLEAQALYDARTARYGADATFTDADFLKIQARARAHAVSTVREYMYDATRQTGVSATATLQRMVPFFAPWADTMRAYSRLMYDDPSRLFRVAGLYSTPFNINAWMDDPFIVDENGDPLPRGSDATKAMVLIGGEWKTTKKGGRVHDGGIALRASSFNTILQGQVPWLPGWGPAVQIPVTVGLNSAPELALHLSEAKDPFTQTLMQSLFMDGEVPSSDGNALMKTIVPAWLRRFVDAKDGVTYARNLGYIMNSRKLDADAKGQPFDYAKELAAAEKQATSAAYLQTVAQFGFGISGDAQVQGKFYVQKMHEFQALSQVDPATGMSPLRQQYGVDTPTAAFALMFPEASELSWSFTRNETGVNATVTAQTAAMKNKALIDANPDYGWFIVGGENMAPGEFSSTAYNQQRQNTYGADEKGRKQLSPGEIAAKVRVDQGWADFTKYTTELSNMAVTQGLDAKVAADARRSIIDKIGQQNPDWYAKYNDRTNKVADFYQRADLIAKDPRLKDRQDIAMYAVYRQAQQEILDSFGLTSFAGTGANSETAKWAMYQIGSKMARQNLGFQQMWERVLASDVEPDIKQGASSVVAANSTGTDL